MMNITEKAAYLKGLADGLAIDKETKEGKLISALIDMVDALAAKVDELDADIDELTDYVEELDEDLGYAEEVLYDDEEECCDGDCECCDVEDCDYCDGDIYEVECPNCGDTICFDETIDESNLTCPACGEKITCSQDEE